MVTQFCVKANSGNGLLPEVTMPLPEPMLACHHAVRSSDNNLRAI